MILRRKGNKSKLAGLIIPYFKPHNVYIELFFGAGGLFFNKPLSNTNILNDIDSDIINLFDVFKNRKDELIEAWTMTPIHEGIFKRWKTEQEADPVWQAIRFLYLSNYSFYGLGNTLHINTNKLKQMLLKYVERTFKKIENVIFTNGDYREVIAKISFKHGSLPFIYADPPYCGTDTHQYSGFTIEQHKELIDYLIDTKINFACSEFDNEEIIEYAKSKSLVVNILCERRNIRNRQTEILITNYRHESLF